MAAPTFPIKLDKTVTNVSATSGTWTLTLSAQAFGLSVVVCPHLSEFAAVGAADGFEIFEQQKGAISAEANDGSLSRTIAFRGYLATLMIDADKFVKLEL